MCCFLKEINKDKNNLNKTHAHETRAREIKICVYIHDL